MTHTFRRVKGSRLCVWLDERMAAQFTRHYFVIGGLGLIYARRRGGRNGVRWADNITCDWRLVDKRRLARWKRP